MINVTLKLLYFFIPELLIWIFIQKQNNIFKFRFGGHIEGNRRMKFIAKTWLVAAVIFFITLFSPDIFSWIFGKKIEEILIGFSQFNVILLTISLAGFAFLWIYNYLLEKKWDKVSWIVLLITLVPFAIFLYLMLS